MKRSTRHAGSALPRPLLACSIAFALLAVNGDARAQSGDEVTTLDRITITAQSREQELQDVPIAINVIDQRLLNDLTAENLKDISDFVPGLVIDANTVTQPTFRLRGVETNDFGIGTDPSVGIFIDGIYSGGGAGGGVMLPFVDVERIEILKGPQGTLLGRNTAAGAISLVTRRPQPVMETRANVRFGNYGKRYADATFNIPTGERSALRVNALVNRSDGWYRDAATGKDLSGDDNWATRMAWQVGLGENTTALFTWEHERLDQKGRVTTGIINLPDYPQRPRVPVTPDDYLDPRKMPIFSDTESFDKRTSNGATLMIDHALAFGHLTATTAWRKFDSSNRAEEDGSNRADLYIDTIDAQHIESVYQEFKFSGHNAHLDWVFGGSYFKENGAQDTDVNTNTEAVDNIVRNLGIAPTPDGSLFGFTSTLAQLVGVPVSLVGDPWNEHFDNTLHNTSYAVFGDVIWKLNDRLNLTFGLRYTRDEKEFSWLNTRRTAEELDAKLDTLELLGFFQALAGMGIPISRDLLTFDVAFIDPPAMANKGNETRSKRSWSNWSPRFVIDYHLANDAMVYTSLARGYKAGGFNSLEIGPNFENEAVWNLETGIKQGFSRFSYNASLFHYRYNNRQSVRLIDPDPDNPVDIPRYIFDTSDLKATGLDIDLRWKPGAHFTLDAAAEWIDSTYRNYITPEGENLDGQATGEPRMSASLGALYRRELGGGELRVSARHAYRGKVRCNAGSTLQGDCGISPVLNIGQARNRSDLRASWLSPHGVWEWALYGNNIFNNRYVRGLNTYGLGPLGVVGATVTPPRLWGMEVTVKF